MYCNDFSKDDIALFFLTSDARKMNWDNNGQWNKESKKYDLANTGLQKRLQKLQEKNLFKGQIRPVDIPEGFSSDEIWTIFDKVFSQLSKNDEVILDITHAFRSLPMLGMALINYAKSLKAISIKGIYYGAFEKLGPAAVVKNKSTEERNAPILNLISFSELHDWTIAADHFVKSGDSTKIVKLTKEKVSPILKTTQGRSLSARTLHGLSKNLILLSGNITTNRGRAIVDGGVVKAVNKSLDKIEKSPQIIPALRPILSKIKGKTVSFNTEKTPNWVAAVQWCIDHNLVQQGITQLQEGVLTQLCKKSESSILKLDYTNEVHRTLPKQAMNIISKRIEKNPQNWFSPANENIETMKQLLRNKLVLELQKPFNSLSSLRNDINHGGYLTDKKPEYFTKKLIEKFNEIQNIIKENS